MFRVFLFLFCLLCASTSVANDLASATINRMYAPQGSVSLGAVLRGGNSPYKGLTNIASILNDNRVDLVPLYLYEGKRFFARGTTAGIHLYQNDTLTIDSIVNYRFDRLEADSLPYFEGLQDRRQTVDGGISLTKVGAWGMFSASIVNDLMDRHNGHEWEFSYRYHWQIGRFRVSPFISYIIQNSELVDYYYGVNASEALPNRKAYHADSANFWRLGLGVSYQVSKQLVAFSNIAVEQIDSSVKQSPLVDEKYLGAAVVGFAYRFGNTFNATSNTAESSALSEWSWRVNSGYQAEGPFHKTHRGYLKRSQDVHTTMLGFTLGKLLGNGKYFDYWGRVSLNRRLERGHQSDFWEYNAYVMAMTTFHSSKTNAELFRYGLGFGFSYASKIPTVERLKQARREKNTARFLNYLEAQFDVPLSVIFGERASERCYTGISLIHRSGIFANSDFLGNVSGGSDMVTWHVECKHR